jgi:hypothetical protein
MHRQKFAHKAKKRMLTLVTEQWKDTTKCRASKTVRCQSARGVRWVGINQKSEYTRVYEDGSVRATYRISAYTQLIGAAAVASCPRISHIANLPGSEERTANQWYNPVHMTIDGPGKYEESYGDERTSKNCCIRRRQILARFILAQYAENQVTRNIHTWR